MMVHAHAEKQTYWMEQSSLWNAVNRSGGFQNYVLDIPIGRAFHADRYVRCIDERTPNGIHAAGSGIYLVVLEGLEKGLKGDDAVQAGLEAAAKKFRSAKASCITSHNECGAAALVYDVIGNEISPQFPDSDNFGRYFATRLAEMLGTKSENLGVHPNGLHIARVAYYDGTGGFNPAVIEQLPKGFVISRHYLGVEQSVREVELAAKIAAGDHGFGGLINKNNPFSFVAVASDEGSLRVLKDEIEPIARKFDGKVVVDGFVARS